MHGHVITGLGPEAVWATRGVVFKLGTRSYVNQLPHMLICRSAILLALEAGDSAVGAVLASYAFSHSCSCCAPVKSEKPWALNENVSRFLQSLQELPSMQAGDTWGYVFG